MLIMYSLVHICVLGRGKDSFQISSSLHSRWGLQKLHWYLQFRVVSGMRTLGMMLILSRYGDQYIPNYLVLRMHLLSLKRPLNPTES